MTTDPDRLEHEAALSHVGARFMEAMRQREERYRRRQAEALAATETGLVEFSHDVAEVVALCRARDRTEIADALERLLPVDSVEKTQRALAALAYFEEEISEDD